MNVLEKILEEIENHAIEFEAFVMCDGYVSVGWIKEIIRSYMDEIENDGWIPVEEELPKKPKYLENSYIVQTNDIIDPFSAYWDGEMWTDVNDDPVNGVIAWQPLPEQYKSKVKTKE